MGSAVTSFQKGDLVLLPFVEGDLDGYASGWGAYSEYAVVGDKDAYIQNGMGPGTKEWSDSYFAQTILKPEDKVDVVQASMIVTFREVLSAIRRFGFQPNESVLIYGAGPVGLCFTKFTKLLGILQAQINPHFLYNTLDSLYWDAFNLGDMELAENIMALSELFRLALSRGKGIVTVEAEFKLIESYLRIQKMRFEKKMDYKINLLSDMKDMEIPKLILQPFVENAIVHGLENTSHIGCVNVHGYLEGEYMVFKISDNGAGMTGEQLQQLFSDDAKQYSTQRISKYAIKNVQERLKLLYNDHFDLKIISTLNVGTTVTIQIPKDKVR